ncbi:hypothetical protein BGX27_006891 [Mortierella sp. AM989]|nr:hypothetical protein BGX27_006891 [Mortierella sp. AM989]
MSGGGIQTEATPEHVAYALLGCFITIFGLVSLFVKEKLFISEACPYAIGVFDPAGWEEFDTIALELTRIVIAVQVMAAGVSLPRSYILKERLSLFMMVVPLTVLMWLTSGLLIWGIIPKLNFLESLMIAACIAPTDPVLSNSVVKGRFAEKHVPPRLRYLMSAESGINDGMGLPFLFLAYYLLTDHSTGAAVGRWFYLVWGYQIIVSIIVGAIFGFAARKLVKGAKNRNLIDKESFLVFSIALALAVTGVVTIIGADDFLACFVAGNVFAWDDWFSNEIAEAHIQEIIDMLLNLACFIFIGASIPFSSFGDSSLGLSVWRLVVLTISVLLLRRPPFVVALKTTIPALTTYRDAVFAGWFGPIGVGAVFYAKLITIICSPEHMKDFENPHQLERARSVVFPIVMFIVFSSVLVHGVTVPLLHLQYKYTRTWSRKREDSNHAVTRLPHINIGDEIVLRPPTINGSIADGEGNSNEQKTIGYDNQRSIGYDNQRSIGYDHQRSVNQRSLGYGSSVPYGGFGIAGVPDLSRNIQSNNNTVRTLQDVVKEMKDASRGAAANRNLRISNADGRSTPIQTNVNTNTNGNNSGNNSNVGSPNPRDSVSISFNFPSSRDGRTSSQPLSPNLGAGVAVTGGESGEEVAQSLKKEHPATHSYDSSNSNSDSTPVRPSPTAHRSSNSVVKVHEVEQEEDSGIIRKANHDIDVDSAQAEQLVGESESGSSQHHPQHLGHHHLTDLFKPKE